MEQSKYLCESWQGLIQYLVTMIGKGYYYYQPIKPRKEMNEERWLQVDEHMLKKFDILNNNKHRRRYNKKCGKSNYLYIRYGNLAYLLKTKGKELESCNTEIFRDIREEPLELYISEGVSLKVYKGRKRETSFTVYLTRECYRSIKTELLTMLEHRKVLELEYKFKILNNLPAYSGINEQKRLIKKSIFISAKKSGIALFEPYFWVNYKRKIYKVFKDKSN